MTDAGRVTGLRRAAPVLALLVLGVAHLYPLSLHPTSMHVGASADTQEMMWRLEWGIHALGGLHHRGFQDANNFYPDDGAYATMDYAYGLIPLSAPFRLFTADPLAIYNLTALASLAIAAWGAYLLGRKLTGSRAAGVVAAAIFAFNPLHLGRIGQLNILAIHMLPWLVLAAQWLFERPTPVRAAVLAAVLFLAITSGGHQAVFAAGVLGWTVVVLAVAKRETRWRGLAGAAGAIAVAGACFYPLAKPYLLGASERHRVRSVGDVTHQSPNPGDLLRLNSAFHRWLGGPPSEAADDADSDQPEPPSPAAPEPKANLLPGWIVWLAAIAGAAELARSRERRTWLWLLAGLTVGGFALSVGAHLPGYLFLFRHLTPLHMIRAPSRFTLVGLLGLAGLAAYATASLGERWAARWRFAPTALAAGLLLLHLGETYDGIGEDTYRYDPPPPVYGWLAAQPGSFGVLELPSTWQLNAFYLVYSSYHWKDLVNGFNASYMDPFHRNLLFDLADEFPSAASEKAMFQILGLKYLVLHLSPDEHSFRLRGSYHARARLARVVEAPPEWLHPVWSGGGSTVLEMVEPESGFTARSITRLAPGRMLRRASIAFETRAEGPEPADPAAPRREVSLSLNGKELGRFPVGDGFESHRLPLPRGRVVTGMNELRWTSIPDAGGASHRAARAPFAVRHIAIEPVREGASFTPASSGR